MLDRARHAQQTFARSPGTWAGAGIFVCVLLLAVANFRNLVRWLVRRRLARHPEEAPSQAAALWYQRMLRWLNRKGWTKDARQTPEEFLIRIEDPGMRKRVENFTRAYEAARFGESSEEARRLPELYAGNHFCRERIKEHLAFAESPNHSAAHKEVVLTTLTGVDRDVRST